MAATHTCVVKYYYYYDDHNHRPYDTNARDTMMMGLLVGNSELELGRARITHRTYGELHAAAFAACPTGFECEEPLALYHEVHWSMRQAWPTTSELHHAIEAGEYAELWPVVVVAAGLRTLCVSAHPVQQLQRRR